MPDPATKRFESVTQFAALAARVLCCEKLLRIAAPWASTCAAAPPCGKRSASRFLGVDFFWRLREVDWLGGKLGNSRRSAIWRPETAGCRTSPIQMAAYNGRIALKVRRNRDGRG